MLGRLPIVRSALTDPVLTDTDPVPVSVRGAAGTPGWLTDRQGRRLKYLRLSVTDRCDLRCQYCMPVEGAATSPKEEVLTIEELARIAGVFFLLGVRTVRLTGGEPLVRRGVIELVRMLRDEVCLTDIAMTTNGSALKHVAAALARAGLARINISVDSVRPEVFREITRGGDLARVIEGIDAARQAGIREIKINTVVVRGLNEDQLPELVDWAWDRNITPRFIELMPIGEGARLGAATVVPLVEMKMRLADRIVCSPTLDHHVERGPAVYAPASDGSGRKVGFIGAVTDNFCDRCNRVRVTARGEIRACLASPAGLSLRDLMRGGLRDEAIVRAIEQTLFGKDDGHRFTATAPLGAAPTRHQEVEMSRVGG